MTVLLRVEQAFPDGSVHVAPMLYPTGRTISKDERQRAEELDSFLSNRMGQIAEELKRLRLLESNSLPKWHALGERLQFVDDVNLVPTADRDTGSVWLAIRQHSPPSLLPAGEEPLTPGVLARRLAETESQRRLGKKHDHFERCYKLGRIALHDVDWMTWSDFDAYLESPGLERDGRILTMLGQRQKQVGRRVTRTEIRAIFKSLREAIPAKTQRRDTSTIPAIEVEELIEKAFVQAGLGARR